MQILAIYNLKNQVQSPTPLNEVETYYEYFLIIDFKINNHKL